ncbi:MAG: TIGR01459 family HAD-type hydrolase [Pseudomonadota bacterium]
MADRDPSRLPPVVPGLGALAARYDGFIVDLWGCLHDGVAPFPGALAALRRLIAAGKRVLVLSNAPRRAHAVAAGMARLGVGADLYDAVLSSGEVAWQALARREDPWHARLGVRCFHLGPDRDLGMLEGNGLVPVGSVEEAEFILATGPRDDQASVAAHEPVLAAGLARRLPMLCANPDLEVIRGADRLICAGALATAYAARGGEVRYHGKPYASVYDAGLRLLGIAERARVLAVGDSLMTDIAGARGAGLDAAFIPGGLHGRELGAGMGETPEPAVLLRLLQAFAVTPSAILPALRW